MKRELMDLCDTTTADSSPSPLSYKRQRIDSERRPIKAEQFESMANGQPQNFPVLRQQNSSKRRALNREFATKLASITLTSDELYRLDAVFGGVDAKEQLEQFSRTVAGCLCRISRHAVHQPNDVIALVDAVVGPVDLHQVVFPRRRIFVFHLGYFEFGQIADQKPDLVDYGPWMADMDIQALPLPSDEFIEQKTQRLQSFLAYSSSMRRETFKMEQTMSSAFQQQITTSNGRTVSAVPQHGNANENPGGHGHDDDEVVVLELDAASSTVKTEVSDLRDVDDDDDSENGDGHRQHPGSEQLEHDEDHDDGSDADANGPTLDDLVHDADLLKRTRIVLSSTRQLADIGSICDCLVGCLAVCRVKRSENIFVDEIVQADASGQLIFKHTSSTPFQFAELTDCAITDKIFRDWVDNLAKWGENLPLYSLFRRRRCALYKRLKELKQSQKLSRNQKLKLRKRKKKEKEKLQQNANENSQKRTERHRQQAPAQHDDSFIGRFTSIFVCPEQLVRLHQIGPSVLARVAVGLFVKQHFGIRVEPITRVSWGAKPYSMYGHELTAVLHFEHGQRCTIKALHTFTSRQQKQTFVRERLFGQQQQKEEADKGKIKFNPPTADVVLRKNKQLKDMLKKAPHLALMPKA